MSLRTGSTPSWPLGVAVFALAALASGRSQAHPHVFIDAEAGFVINGEGRLAAVEITHFYDPLVTLLLLQDLGVNPFAELNEGDARRIADEQEALFSETGGFATLSIGGSNAALGPADGIAVSIDGDRMRVDFTRPLIAPAALGDREARLRIFDPVFFMTFDLIGQVRVTGGSVCTAEALDWAPSEKVLALQAELSALPRDETPSDETVGRFFAAEARLTCR